MKRNSHLQRRRRTAVCTAAMTCALVGTTAVSAAQAPATQPTAVHSTTHPQDASARAGSRPTKSSWTAAVHRFAAALSDPTSAAPYELLADDAVIRQFNRSQREEPDVLRQAVAGHAPLALRSYLETPQTLAGDIASDIRDLELSEEVKRRLTPPDENTTGRANEIATKWIASSLYTSGNDPIAVIILCQTPPPESAEESSTTELIGPDDELKQPAPVHRQHLLFVLVKGEFRNEQFRITEVRYGDPVPQPAEPAAEETTAHTDDD